MDMQDTQENSIEPQMAEVSMTTAYSGMVPPPVMLKQFNDVDSSFAERIFKMVEAQNDHSIQRENTLIKNDYTMKKRGQFSALAIVTIGYILAFISPESSSNLFLLQDDRHRSQHTCDFGKN